VAPVRESDVARRTREDARHAWESVAPSLERLRDRMFESNRAVSEWLVERLDPHDSDVILELTAGPGETGFLAAERVGPKGRLVCTDHAPAMVEVARRGAAARGLDNVAFEVVDAQRIDLAARSVDGVLSRFGLMLMPDPVQAFTEIRRVLRPGRRLAYAVFGPPERNVWIGLLLGALIQNGHPVPGDPFAPGGFVSLAAAGRNRALLSEVGFEDITVTEVGGVVRFADVDDYWTVQTSVAGPVAEKVATMSDEEIEAVRSTIELEMALYRDEDGYALPSVATVVTAA
jgi:ubiquinone/menaquinone biosynthesis C-methylase UbiE